jgi:hypothetical protein
MIRCCCQNSIAKTEEPPQLKKAYIIKRTSKKLILCLSQVKNNRLVLMGTKIIARTIIQSAVAGPGKQKILIAMVQSLSHI